MEQMIQVNQTNFIKYENKTFAALFSTADNGMSYNLKDPDLQQKFDDLRTKLNIDDICYLQQTHSDKILICDENNKFHGNYEADALITTLKGSAVGIFTADCVPVIVIDEKNNVAAAVHSGWRGTISNIVGKTISKMHKDFGCLTENIKVFIGPHNKQCCYEVSEELINEFKSRDIFKNSDISNGRYLSLEKCIYEECEKCGISKNNIYTTDYCTFCSENVKFHSYRKSGKSAGRQFSLVYIK